MGAPPSTPRNLQATSGDGRVFLEWTAPVDSGSSAISGYEYRYTTASTFTAADTWSSVWSLGYFNPTPPLTTPHW